VQLLGSRAVFVAYDANSRRQLWGTDGTADGTVQLTNSNFAVYLFAGRVGSRAVFSAYDSNSILQLWSTDGTVAGTFKLTSSQANTNAFYSVVSTGAFAVFTMEEGTTGPAATGQEPWVTDGTPAGTRLLSDIVPGSESSRPTDVVACGSMVLFSTTSAANGREFWATNGTSSGTLFLGDLTPGTGGTSLEGRPASASGGCVFATKPDSLSAAGATLWATNGTAATTRMLRSLAVTPDRLLEANDKVWATGDELVVTDGTTAGTRALGAWTIFDGLVPIGSRVFGGALRTARTQDFEPFVSDGAPAGTGILADLEPANESTAFGPCKFMPIGARVVFDRASRQVRGTFSNDGSALGDLALSSSLTKIGDSSGECASVRLGGALYFSGGTDSDIELWRTDGTAAGTVRVKDLNSGYWGSNPRRFYAVGSTAYFAASEDAGGEELWRTDGTEAGTYRVKDIYAGISSSSPSSFAAMGNTLFFAARDASGVELWKSDGTALGTVRVKDIAPGSASSAPSGLVAFGGYVYFAAGATSSDVELWRTDGTDAGTTRVKDLRPGTMGSFPNQLTVAGSTLFFSADDGQNGRELWKTDGTDAGTVVVADIANDRASSTPTNLVDFRGRLVFLADDAIRGKELWTSDGTRSGTRLLHDVMVGPAASAISDLVVADGLLYFVADAPLVGRQMWRSSGWPGGLQMIRVGSSVGDSGPAWISNASERLFFTAYDHQAGRELWSLRLR
jgi:ELWxxDGT repeat protein